MNLHVLIPGPTITQVLVAFNEAFSVPEYILHFMATRKVKFQQHEGRFMVEQPLKRKWCAVHVYTIVDILHSETLLPLAKHAYSLSLQPSVLVLGCHTSAAGCGR